MERRKVLYTYNTENKNNINYEFKGFFLGFGIHFVKRDGNSVELSPEHVTTAIIEKENGTVEQMNLRCIKFIYEDKLDVPEPPHPRTLNDIVKSFELKT